MQSTHSDPKSERIEARVRAEDKTLFKKAAALAGMSFTDFTVQALKLASIKVIKEHNLIELSLRDQTLFAESLIKESEPNEYLINAAKRHKKRMQE